MQLVGIDLSLLTASLYPPEALAEPDVPWEFDALLQQVSQVRRAAARLQSARLSALISAMSCSFSHALLAPQAITADKEIAAAQATQSAAPPVGGGMQHR